MPRTPAERIARKQQIKLEQTPSLETRVEVLEAFHANIDSAETAKELSRGSIIANVDLMNQLNDLSIKHDKLKEWILEVIEWVKQQNS